MSSSIPIVQTINVKLTLGLLKSPAKIQLENSSQLDYDSMIKGEWQATMVDMTKGNPNADPPISSTPFFRTFELQHKRGEWPTITLTHLLQRCLEHLSSTRNDVLCVEGLFGLGYFKGGPTSKRIEGFGDVDQLGGLVQSQRYVLVVQDTYLWAVEREIIFGSEMIHYNKEG